jgi:hypothetical protein
MDQEREKLARLRDAALCALGPWADQPVVSDETTRAELVRNVSAALEQWGDLRAEQVSRETVEEAARLLCLQCQFPSERYGPAELHQGQWWHMPTSTEWGNWYSCGGEVLRRAFAASQGGT